MEKEFLKPTYFTDYETDSLVLNIKYSRREAMQRFQSEIETEFPDIKKHRIYKDYVRTYDENLDGDNVDDFMFIFCSENEKGAFKVWRCDLKTKED